MRRHRAAHVTSVAAAKKKSAAQIAALAQRREGGRFLHHPSARRELETQVLSRRFKIEIDRSYLADSSADPAAFAGQVSARVAFIAARLGVNVTNSTSAVATSFVTRQEAS